MSATTNERTYLLGHSEHELARLQRQSDFYAPLTLQALRLAGIGPGMRVLDAGCGSGAVSLLLARLVGPTGEVIAVDRASEALTQAEQTVERAGLGNVHLVQGDVSTMTFDAPVDAVVGRLILMHVSDPVATLQNLATGLHQRGIVLVQEMDIAMARTEPPVELVDDMIELVRQAFRRSGLDYRPGMKLHDQFVKAGLPAPQLVSLGRIEAAPAPASIALLTGVLTTLLPAIEATGLATAAELQLETLPQRLHTELEASEGLVITPPLISAWSTLG